MRKLPTKKLVQTQKFLSNIDKASRLEGFMFGKHERVIGRNVNDHPTVYRVNIGGRVRAVKLEANQDVAKWVSDSIRREHALAIKSGFLKPKRYVLNVVNFLAASDFGGVMPLVKAVDYAKLRKYFGQTNKSSSSEGEEFVIPKDYYVPKNEAPSPKAVEFIKKHPWVTDETLRAAYSELRVNLEKLFTLKKIPIFDLANQTNVFVVGALDKEKKLVFALIDQLHPFSEDEVSNRYYSSKKK